MMLKRNEFSDVESPSVTKTFFLHDVKQLFFHWILSHKQIIPQASVLWFIQKSWSVSEKINLEYDKSNVRKSVKNKAFIIKEHKIIHWTYYVMNKPTKAIRCTRVKLLCTWHKKYNTFFSKAQHKIYKL